jgi:hypothetical protein
LTAEQEVYIGLRDPFRRKELLNGWRYPSDQVLDAWAAPHESWIEVGAWGLGALESLSASFAGSVPTHFCPARIRSEKKPGPGS